MRIGTADAEAAAAAAAAAVSNNQLRYLITATTAARADKERSAIASTKQSFSFFLATFHPFFFIFSQTLYSRPKLLHFFSLSGGNSISVVAVVVVVFVVVVGVFVVVAGCCRRKNIYDLQDFVQD